MLAATWFTAIATGLLAIFAVITAWYARKAFREQSEEVVTLKTQLRDQRDLSAKQTPVLELQVKELSASLKQREEEARERHRSHARTISAILAQEGEPNNIAIDLINRSQEPVYNVVVGLVYIQGAGPATLERWLELRQHGKDIPIPVTTVSVLPPAESFPVRLGGAYGLGIPSGRLAVEVAFTDRNDSHWIRRARGQLEELEADPLIYFARLGLYGPYEFQTPRRIAPP